MIKKAAPPAPLLPKSTVKNGLALYVHWPWCIKKCPYCDFNAHVNKNRDENLYLSCLIKELEYWSLKVNKNSLTSLFFGGGTPSLADCTTIEQVITAAKKHLHKHPCNTQKLEVTLEVNPATYRPEMFHKFVSAGVTRFSIGVQSLSSDELTFLGRAHDVNEALTTIEQAQKSGAEVSVDFIYGLPNFMGTHAQNLARWQKNLAKISAFGTDHVSAYQLTIEPGTKFFADVNKNQWQPLSDDLQADFFTATQETLATSGFQGYEISNFARPGTNNMLKVCQHNLHVWRYGDYLGIGAGAHGRITNAAGQRIATRNFRMPETYQKEVADKNHALYEKTPLSTHESAQEAVLNGLRLSEGILIGKNAKNASKLLTESLFHWSSIQKLVNNHLLTQENCSEFISLKTTPRGQLLLDSILPEILKSA